jgi:transcriptional regulator with XRE-family HTH domain
LATSSTVARWELAHRIKVRRQELGVSVEQIAKHLGFTRNFFSAVENERSMLATDKLEVLLVMLEFDDSDQDEMMALDEAARQRGWWESREVVDVLGEQGARFLGLEQGASQIRTYDSLLIPGLLQAPEYVRAALESDPLHSPLRINEVVNIRLRRQSTIKDRTPITTLMSEAALRQHWGPPELQSRQLAHILQCVDSYADLKLRILTFDVPPSALASSSTLCLLDFGSRALPSVCYQEAIRSLSTVDSTDPQYQRFDLAYERALERSLLHSESVDLVREMIQRNG